MLTKLSAILTENGGIGSSRSSNNGSSLNKYTNASIYRLHEDLKLRMKDSIRNMRRETVQN